MKDYYHILKITRSANSDEIKRGYRQAALFWHLDKNKVYNAQEKFIEISEAYNILIDPVKRNLYEKLLNDSTAIPNDVTTPKENKDDFAVYNQWVKEVRIKAEKLSLSSIDDALTNTFHFLNKHGKTLLWKSLLPFFYQS